jgi:hypothetical protein
MKEPISVSSWNTFPPEPMIDPWFFNADNPRWGNNAEDSSSSGPRMPRLQRMFSEEPLLLQDDIPVQVQNSDEERLNESQGKEMVIYYQEFARTQILASFHQEEPLTLVTAKKKRKSRAKTPIMDDEVRRSSRFKVNVPQQHIRLDNEPRKKKGESKKSVSFSTVENMKIAIINRGLDTEMEAADIEPIQSEVLLNLGSTFCGIPPEELADADLTQSSEE